MKIKPFLVEEWMGEHEGKAIFNIAETCVESITLDEIFELTDVDREEYFKEFGTKRLTYGNVLGTPKFLEEISRLYKTIKPDEVLTTHGAAGANHLVFFSMIGPGDEVVSIMPTYQQLYSIPESFGANVKILCLKKEDGFIPDLNDLKKLVTKDTKLICINNPNNPTGSLMNTETMMEIVEIAREVDAYILCDEVYRQLNQDGEVSESIADLYEKGISTCSMSKVFSLAGLRLGWVATKDKALMKSFIIHRDYNMISCGMLNEDLAALALNKQERILQRSHEIVTVNLKILDDWVNTEPRVSYVKPKAGTTALVYYDFDILSFEFCKNLLEETGVFVTPGDCFGQPHSMRIGYANNTTTLTMGLEKLSEYIRTLEFKDII